MRWLVALLALPLAAAVDNLRVVDTTATQAIISYAAPDTSACTVEISEDPSYSPVVHDVNATLFSGSNSDSRTGNITLGRHRTITIGQRKVETASDDKNYSRALETDRLHYGRVTCGGDQTTFTFRTRNIPFGDSHGAGVMQAMSDGSGRPLIPSVNYTTRTKIIDPLTGVPMWPIMMPRDYTTDQTFSVDTCSGTGWSGVCQVVTDDSTYASTSTTNPLLVVANITAFSYGQSGIDVMDFVQFPINGYGAGGTEAQRTVNVCLTRDNGQTCSPTQQVVLPATDGNVTAGTGTAGDWWEPGVWHHQGNTRGAGWVKTASSTPTTSVTFTTSTDCNRLRVGSVVQVFPDGSTTKTYLTVQSLECPSAVVDSEVNLYNGGLGVPFLIAGGIQNNKGFGLKIWKANDDGQAIYIDRTQVTVGRTSNFYNGSAGFHNTCSKKDTANGGWYKCIASNSGNPATEMYAIRETASGVPEIRNMGAVRFTGSLVGCTGYAYPITFGFGARPWDGSDSNVIWATCNDDLIKATFTNTSYTEKDPGGIPIADFSLVNISDSYTISSLISAFASANDIWYEPYYGTSWGMEAVQGNYVILGNRMGQQDSFAWIAVLDTGNKLPLGSGWVGSLGGTNPEATDGTGFVKAMASLFDRSASRWNTLHTFEWVGHEPVMCPEVQTAGKATAFGIGPYKTTLKTAMTSCNPCGEEDIDVDSTWDTTTYRTPTWGPTALNSSGTTVTPASGNIKEHLYIGSKIKANPGGGDEIRTVTAVSGNSVTIDTAFSSDLSSTAFTYTFPTAPAWWHVGDPIGDRAPWALLKVDAGDRIQIDSEYVTVVSRTENAEDLTIRVQRSGSQPAHNIDAVINMRGKAGYANYWYFTLDRNASTSTYYAPYDALNIGHGTYGNGIRVQSNHSIQVADIKDYTNWNQQTHSISKAPNFAGKHAPADGNSYQSHPSNIQYEATGNLTKTFYDLTPFQGTNLFSVQNNTAATRVSGFTHVYKYLYGQSRAMYTKHLDTWAVAGARLLTDISGPGSSITDSDRYKYCVATVANECVTGSAVGDIYLNVPNLVQTYRYCAAGEVSTLGPDWDDACAGEKSMAGHVTIQFGVFGPVNDTVASHGRVLETQFTGLRYSTTANARPLPDASLAVFSAQNGNRNFFMLLKIPPLPPRDSVNRSTFIPIPVQLSPPASLSVNNAIVEFGYDTNFYCTSRLEACVANGSTVNETTPFTWPTEAGGESSITGVSCASGCTVTVPAFSQRVLYYRWKYRNASNVVLATSSTQVMAVP